MEKNKKLRLVGYPRKSSEDKSKQIQSIESQTAIIKEVANRRGDIELIDILPEVKSGKTPHGRPVFEKMLKRIQAGEADGIIVWKLDRLGRNPIDLAQVQWMLEQNIIKVIITPEKEYHPEDSSYIISVEGAGASQFIRDLSANVKRGLKDKLNKGWLPTTAPAGYLNTITEARGENYIIKDPERFPIIRKAWDLMLTGEYTVDQILEKLNNEWGFRSRPGRKGSTRGGKPMGRSTLYRIFTNPFFMGMIEYHLGGKKSAAKKEIQLTPGKHEPMVSVEEYGQVQKVLGRDGKQRPTEHHEYAFTGIIRCGRCGGTISATSKEKLIKSTGKMKPYTLYYCVQARKNKEKCSERNYTNLIEIEGQIMDEISHFTILPEFKEWATNVLNNQNDKDFEEHNKIIEAHQKALHSAERQLSNLTRMRMLDQLDDEEYEKERVRLKNEITILKAKESQIDMQKESWTELTKRAFVFASNAGEAFNKGDAGVKRSILLGIGLNWTLLDHSLSIQEHEWLIPFKKQASCDTAQKEPFEPAKIGLLPREKAAEAAFNPIMRGQGDLNP